MTLTITDLFCGAGGSGLGNGVTPPAAEFLLRAVAESLGGAA